MVDGYEEEKNLLKDMFPDVPSDHIDYIIQLVINEDPLADKDYQLEGMINLLTETGDSVLSPPASPSNAASREEGEGAVGYGIRRSNSRQHFGSLTELLPDISPKYLEKYLDENDCDLDTLIDKLTTCDYPRKEIDYDGLWEQLKSVLPGADPTFLRNQARNLARRPEEINKFIHQAIENNDYPTMQDYLKRQKEEQAIKAYKQFDVTKFLEEIPDPETYFAEPNHNFTLSGDNVEESNINYATNFLYNHYKFLRKKHIDRVFKYYNKDLIKTCQRLDRLPRAFRNARRAEVAEDIYNEALVQQIAYLQHRKEIKHFLKMKSDAYRNAREYAKENGLFQKCSCCFEDELLPEECFFCKNNCTFCKECVRKGAEMIISKGESRFPCFCCDSEFSILTLKMVLDKQFFDKVAQKIQSDEIRNANIPGLETCPHCDFSMIPDENDKVFKCQNVDCMKETCRLCHHPAHIPLKCNEVEYDEDVKLRTFIENEMTRALVRKCHKCGKEFIKSSGCNKMTCVCGGMMCYVCGQAIRDYNHFGDDRCPLYTENMNEFHFNRVWQAAQKAAKELGIDGINKIVKFDPRRNLDQHYNTGHTGHYEDIIVDNVNVDV